MYPFAHGMPIFHGEGEDIGIDMDAPDLGERLSVAEDEVMVYWACGATS